jgi:ubiquinone/menaquinone biosynthesis C-methylase UbiE
MSMDQDAYRERMRRTWGEMAAGWAARSERAESALQIVSDWLVQRTDPRPGQVVLDVAAGPGGLGHRVARVVGSGGRVISTDLVPEMVEAARRLGAADGLGNVEHRTLDAEHMDLDDDTVDVVLCRSGYMLMADPVAALRETRRVLKAEGSLGFSVFATADTNPHVAIPVGVFIERGHIPPPEPGGPGIFSMGDPARIRELVTAASFALAAIEPIEFAFRYDDEDDAWNTIIDINGLLSPIISEMGADEREATRQAVIDGFADFRDLDGSYSVPARVWAVLAR